VLDWISQAARSGPDHPFIVTRDRSWMTAEVEDRVASMAGGLREAGVMSGVTVGLVASNDVDSVTAMFAIWRAGGAVQLLDPRLAPAELDHQTAQVGVTLVIGGGASSDSVNLIAPSALRGTGVRAGEIDPARVAWIVFTSGSAGRPKGVRLTFANLEASASASTEHLGHDSDDVWLCNLPISHVGGASILVRSAREASTVMLEPRFDPLQTAAALRAGAATIASLVAVTLARTLDVHPGRYSGVKAVLVGGGPVPFDLVERARAAGLPVLPTYGMTETASQIATARPEDGKVVAVPGAEIRSVDGRLGVRGPMLFDGYVGEGRRDAADWFETGDLGTVSADGVIEVLGRADDVIVTGGENVHPSEVEAVLGEHPGVDAVVVMGYPDPDWGQSLIAVYEGGAAPGELERHARYRLAGFKIPRRWVATALPRLAVGKVDRRAAREIADGSP